MPGFERHNIRFSRQSRAGGGLVLAAIMLLPGGCGDSSADPRGVRVPAEGLVVLNNTKLPHGRIIFVSSQGHGEVKASASIQDGCFSFTEENGPLEGEARVEIYPVELELEQFESVRGGNQRRKVDVTPMNIPRRYNVQSILAANVTSNRGSNNYNFELTTKRN